jgi:hypothetical protein
VVQRSVGDGGVQDLLRLRASGLGDAERDLVIAHAFKETTRATYNRYLSKFYEFCSQEGVQWPSLAAATERHVGAFFAHVTRKGARPSSVLKGASAAVALALEAHGLPNPRSAQSSALGKLVLSLTRERTKAPRSITPVLPLAQVLARLRLLMADGSLAAVREALVVAVSLFGFVRSRELEHVKLAQCHVVDADPAPHQLHIAMFNFKNDTDLGGATLRIPGSSERSVCVACIFETYVKLTARLRGSAARQQLLVLSLPRTNHPCAGLRASAIGTIKNRFGRAVNPADAAFLNNWTRKLGASTLLDAGVSVSDVVNYGRWRNVETFTKHYVQRPLQPNAFNDIIAAQSSTAVPPMGVPKSDFKTPSRARRQIASPPLRAFKAARASPSTPSLSSPLTPSLSPIGFKVQRRKARNWSALSTPSLSSSSSFRESPGSSSEASSF